MQAEKGKTGTDGKAVEQQTGTSSSGGTRPQAGTGTQGTGGNAAGSSSASTSSSSSAGSSGSTAPQGSQDAGTQTQTGASGSTTPFVGSGGNTYKVTNPNTGEVRYFETAQARDAYIAQYNAAKQQAADAKTAQDKADFEDFKQTAIAAHNVKAQQSLDNIPGAMVDVYSGVSSIINANQAAREARENRREQEAADKLVRAATDISNGQNLEAAHRTLLDVADNYSETSSAIEALYLLGLVYSAGIGVDVDAAMAATYFDRAEDNGSSKAVKKRLEYITDSNLQIMLTGAELTALYNNRKKREEAIDGERFDNFQIRGTFSFILVGFTAWGISMVVSPEEDWHIIAGAAITTGCALWTFSTVSKMVKKNRIYKSQLNSVRKEINHLAPYFAVQPAAMNIQSLRAQSNVQAMGLSLAFTF